MSRCVRFVRWRPIGLLLPLLGTLTMGCSDEMTQQQQQDQITSIDVEPALANVPPVGTATFVALAVGGTPTPQTLSSGVSWTASAGTITTAGFYTAPSALGTYQVQASYGGKSGAATVNVVSQGLPGAMYSAASSYCAALPIRATGVTHYFCDCQTGAQVGCVAGSDSNSGTSATAPKQSWAQVLSTFNSMNGGDTIALCQGGAWTSAVAGTIHNARCAAATDMKAAANTTTCDIRDYAPSWGGTAKPLIQQTANQYVFLSQQATQAGVRIMNLALAGTGNGPGGGTVLTTQVGIYLQGANNDIFICNNTFDKLYIGVQMQPFTNLSINRVNVWGDRFTNNTLDAILGGGNNSSIDSCFFDNNGSNVATAHGIYLNGGSVGQLSSFALVNNEMRRSGAPTVCLGTIIVVHDQFDGLNIENNIVDGGSGAGGGCWGIAIDHGGYTTPGYYRHLTIRRNVIQNVGYAPISVGQAAGPIIENNIIQAAAGSLAIHVPGLAARASPADDQTSAAFIRNNTIYSASPNAASIGISVGDINEGTGYVIANNAISFGAALGTCMSLPLPVANYTYVNHQLCNTFQKWEAARGTLAAWQTYSGGKFDSASLTSAPQFESPPTSFKPLTGSPLIGNGDTTQAPTYDYMLNTRPNPPSIGALEP